MAFRAWLGSLTLIATANCLPYDLDPYEDAHLFDKRAIVPYAAPYSYVGCYSDANPPRTLRYELYTPELGENANMTVENCAFTCNSYGYTHMGLEYFYQVCIWSATSAQYHSADSFST